MSKTTDTYSYRVVKYRTRCYGCGRLLGLDDEAFGSAPGVDNRRKRWRWICSRDCAHLHGIELAPVGEFAKSLVREERFVPPAWWDK